MTNLEIITGEMLLHGINEEVHTFAEWNNRGKKIIKGNKALFKTHIWKPVTKTDKKTGEETQKMIMVSAAFFGKSQVEDMPAWA